MLKRVLLFVLLYQIYVCSVWCVSPKMDVDNTQYTYVDVVTNARLLKALNSFHTTYSRPDAELLTLAGREAHLDRLRLANCEGPEPQDIVFNQPVQTHYHPCPRIATTQEVDRRGQPIKQPTSETPESRVEPRRVDRRTSAKAKLDEAPVTQAQLGEMQAQLVQLRTYIGMYAPTPKKSNTPTHRFHAHIVRIANPYFGNPHNHRHTHLSLVPLQEHNTNTSAYLMYTRSYVPHLH